MMEISLDRIKMVFTDIDGVWTDCGMYYDQNGNELKKFNTYDGVGVYLAHKVGLKVGIITGENTNIVSRRAQKLKVDFLFQGVSDKLSVIQKVCKENQLDISEIAYIGDDINDISVLRSEAFSATPSSSPIYIKKFADIVLSKKGGEGVFREFIEFILQRRQKSKDNIILDFIQ